MNNFRVKCLLQLQDKFLSFHPAAEELQLLIPPTFAVPEAPTADDDEEGFEMILKVF
jgi:hypothetical protein